MLKKVIYELLKKIKERKKQKQLEETIKQAEKDYKEGRYIIENVEKHIKRIENENI